jgi:hypothetical protein
VRELDLGLGVGGHGVGVEVEECGGLGGISEVQTIWATASSERAQAKPSFALESEEYAAPALVVPRAEVTPETKRHWSNQPARSTPSNPAARSIRDNAVVTHIQHTGHAHPLDSARSPQVPKAAHGSPLGRIPLELPAVVVAKVVFWRLQLREDGVHRGGGDVADCTAMRI